MENYCCAIMTKCTNKHNVKRLITIIFDLILCLGCMPQTVKTVELKKAGTLAELLTDEEKASVTELTIIGKLNSSDISVLRRMCGANDKWIDFTWHGQLQVLDLTDASFVKDSKPYYIKKANPDFILRVNRSYTVYSSSGIVQSRSQYLNDLKDEQNHGATNILASRDPARKLNKIEQLKEGPQSFILREIDDKKWKEIKNNGWNVFDDHYIDRVDDDPIYKLYYHTVKNKVSANMFCGCRTLQKILLNTKTISIGGLAFAGCVNLQEITIPQNVERIAKSAFKKTPSLGRVNISSKSKCEDLMKDDNVITAKFFSESSDQLELIRSIDIKVH